MHLCTSFRLQLTWFTAAIMIDAHRQEALRIDCVCCLRLRARRWWWHEDDAAELRADDADADDRADGGRLGLVDSNSLLSMSGGSNGGDSEGSNGGASVSPKAQLEAPLLDKVPVNPIESGSEVSVQALGVPPRPPAYEDNSDFPIARQHSVIPTKQIYAVDDDPALPRAQSFRGPRIIGCRRYAWKLHQAVHAKVLRSVAHVEPHPCCRHFTLGFSSWHLLLRRDAAPDGA